MTDPSISVFLNELLSNLNSSGIDYCVLRQYFELPENLSGSDIDILIEPSHFEDAKRILLASGHSQDFNLIKETSYGQVHFFHFYRRSSSGYVFLRIDLNRDQYYFGASLLTAKEILVKKTIYRSFFVAHPVHEIILSLIFPLLASGRIKEKHKNRIVSVGHENREQLGLELGRLFGRNLSRKIFDAILDGDLDVLSNLRFKIMANVLSRGFCKRPLKTIKDFSLFVKDLLVLRVHPPGCAVLLWHPNQLFITTINKQLSEASKTLLLGEHRLIRQKTIFLPSIEHLNMNNSVGFAFLLLDYMLAYFVFIRKSLRRHGIVIIDSSMNRFIATDKCRLMRLILHRSLLIDLTILANNAAAEHREDKITGNCLAAIIEKIGPSAS